MSLANGSGRTGRLSWRLEPEESFSDWKVVIKVSQISSSDASSSRKRAFQELEDGKTYNIHKCVLGLGERKSEYFAAIFKTKVDLLESRNNTSEIQLDPEAAEVFPIMLDFIYGLSDESIQVNPEDAMPLYHLGNYFRVPKLLSALEAFLQKDSANFHLYMEAASTYNLEKPLELLVKVCAENFSEKTN